MKFYVLVLVTFVIGRHHRNYYQNVPEVQHEQDPPEYQYEDQPRVPQNSASFLDMFFGRKKKSNEKGQVSVATIAMFPDPVNEKGKGISGSVMITQKNPKDRALLKGKIIGLKPNSKHGLHFHATGNIFPNCTASGLHFNPTGVTHGDRHARKRHVGDLGNVQADGNGAILFSFHDKFVTLSGKSSVVGRALVLHEKEDDLGKKGDEGSLATGNSGSRLACGVVGVITN